MRTTLAVDSAGRVVLPKPLRQRFRLHAGSTLRIEVRDETIILRPERPTPAALTETHGLMVHEGRADETLANWVARDRDQRDRDVSGGAP